MTDAAIAAVVKIAPETDASARLWPKGFLGAERFAAYRAAIEGARYVAERKINVAPIDRLSPILKRLREAGFSVDLDAGVAERLRLHTAHAWSDMQGAKERVEALDLTLRARGERLRPYQKTGVEWLISRHGAVLADEQGLGKAQPWDEPVLTPLGWKNMGDLRVGDYGIGRSGLPVPVTGVFPRGKKPVYTITMNDGARTHSCGEHLWHVETRNDRHRKSGGRVMTLNQIRERGTHDKFGHLFCVPLITNPVQYHDRGPLPIHPYLLGALLANGGMTEGSANHSGTAEQREALSLHLPDGIELRSVEEFFCRLTKEDHVGWRNPLISSLRDLELWGSRSFEKFVPPLYLLGASQDRLSLLQGLLDNDGTISLDGNVVEYNTTSPRLSDDVVSLVRSLGGSAWKSTRVPSYTYKGEKLLGRTDHRIRIALPEDMLPFRVPSKAARYHGRPKYQASHWIDDISYAGETECLCITVDALDHLYVTRDFIVTHNSLEVLATVPANAPVLVVCPATVKGVWAKETRRWRPTLRVTVLGGRGSFRWPEEGEVVVINFDVLPDAHLDGCKDRSCEGCVPLPGCPEGCVLVIDEAHKIKNPKAQRTRACRAITRHVRTREGRSYILTGTPLQNRPEELWNVFQAGDVALEAFGSWAGFVACFNGQKEAIYTKDKAGKRVVRHVMKWGSPTDEAADRIRRVFLRRTKNDVAKDLPSKSWKTIPVTLDQKTLKKCDELLKEIGGADELVRLLSEGGKVAFEKMSETRAALCAAKIPTMLEAIEPYEEADEPLLVFAWHRAPIDYLEERDGWAVITGDTPTKERELVVDRFQAGELRGLAATIQAAGTGLTLTRSSNVLFVDRSWNPADNAQAEDRVHRISQERPVTITLLVAEHALDERVQELLTAKQALIDGSVEKARDTR